MRRLVTPCLAALVFVAALRASTTADFQKNLEADLIRALPAIRGVELRDRPASERKGFSFTTFVLEAEVALFDATHDARYLTEAREDLLWLVHSCREPGGAVRPYFKEFRYLASFCDAYKTLKAHALLSASECQEVDEQITVSMRVRMGHTDMGAQNRGLIYGSEFLFAADAVPHAVDAPEWRRRGQALTEDSLSGWDVEDASIYEPFWFNYTLTLTELLGTSESYLKTVQGRFYLEHARQLQMPDGLLPDWGDGDWTESWGWNVANLVRGGSVTRDGRYLAAAERLYTAASAFWTDLRGEHIGGVALALRWLDPSVPLEPEPLVTSREVVDDLVSKKITFRNPAGAYALLNYRDQGPFGRFTRDYLNASLEAREEKPHHGHADENAFCALVDHGTVLLASSGYRTNFSDGYRADVYQNRLVARTGVPRDNDLLSYLEADTSYHEVTTEKIAFGTLGSLDYSRTRLVDPERGYSADRIVLFAPDPGFYMVVDSVLVQRGGNKVFATLWHPDQVLSSGPGYVVSWPRDILVRHGSWVKSGPIPTLSWPNPHASDLLIEAIHPRDAVMGLGSIVRRYRPSAVSWQGLRSTFVEGQRLTFVSVLTPHPAGSFTPAMLGRVTCLAPADDDGRTLGLSFSLGGDPVVVGLKLDPSIGLTQFRGRPMSSPVSGTVAYADLKTDADMAFVREHRDGSTEFGFMAGTHVHWKGRSLFQMPVDTTMYQGADGVSAPEVRDRMPRWWQVVPR